MQSNSGTSALPAVPWLASAALGGFPPGVLDWPLQRIARSVARRHPELFARLGEHAGKAFLIEPLDLPLAFRLFPQAGATALAACRRPVRLPWNARIAGPFAALVGMLHGELDGDALFFSGGLLIEGDTEAVVALRNALDDREIDLLTEFTEAFAPVAKPLEPLARACLRQASRLTGFSLVRPER